MAVSDRVHVRAPGKLNLFFEVGAAQDDGYHDVASAYQAVSLWEDVYAQPADGFTLSVSGSVDVSGVPADDRRHGEADSEPTVHRERLEASVSF